MEDTQLEPEIVEGALVEVEAAPIQSVRAGLPPVAVQAAAVAGAGLVVGATAVALVGRRRARKSARRGSLKLGSGRKAGRLDVVTTRTFLVDVHLVDRR
jgi:hypothetical protein